MRREVERDMSAAAYDFERIVWPAISGVMGGGEIMPVETTASDDMRRALDRLAGIDAWQVASDQGMRGLACRIQVAREPLPSSWHSFTLRKHRPGSAGSETEVAKRLRAFLQPERGWLLPHLTVQAYMTEPKREGDLIAVGIVKTADLLAQYISPGPDMRDKVNPDDGVTFDVVLWHSLRAAGYKVEIVKPPGQAAEPAPVPVKDWRPEVAAYLADCAAAPWLDPRYHPTAAGALKMICHGRDAGAADAIRAAFGDMGRAVR